MSKDMSWVTAMHPTKIKLKKGNRKISAFWKSATKGICGNYVTVWGLLTSHEIFLVIQCTVQYSTLQAFVSDPKSNRVVWNSLAYLTQKFYNEPKSNMYCIAC